MLGLHGLRAAFAATVLCALSATQGFAWAQAVPTVDLKDTRDPPGFKRIDGSVIVGQMAKDFLSYDLVVGKADWIRTRDKPDPVRTVEGRLVRTLYLLPAGVSPLDAVRNYEQDLRAAGTQILFRCHSKDMNEAGDCGRGMIERKLLDSHVELKGQSSVAAGVYGSRFGELEYLAGRTPRAGSDFVVALAAWTSTSATIHKGYVGRTLMLLDVVETKPVVERMVLVNAAALQAAIKKSGRVSVYGILFDFNSAVIKPDSQQQLGEIALLLKRNPEWKLDVIGHTDSVGGADFNQKLSEQRARAVVDALAQKEKIAPARLRAQGRGLTQPVASNDTEEGRTQNRRVELIRQ
jgi:outer membrane protein OmpA-like peptidoglycan-associated protein